MEFERYRRPSPVIGLSALIDVLFILLIFVVLAARFTRPQGLDIDLANADAPTLTTDQVLSVAVDPEGLVSVEGQPVEPAQLESKLRSLRPRYATLVLFADGALALEKAVSVLAKARAAGFEQLSMATEPERGSGPE